MFCGDSAPCGVCHQCARGRESLCEDLLYLLGGFAEKLLVPERVVRTNLHALPEGVPLALAPLAEPLACAVHALDVVDVRPGDPVAILGGGSLGLMLCGLVASAGGAPIVLDPHPERLAARGALRRGGDGRRDAWERRRRARAGVDRRARRGARDRGRRPARGVGAGGGDGRSAAAP